MSGFLLDTKVPTEIVRIRPDPRVNAWMFAQDDSNLHVSVVTVGELRKHYALAGEPPSFPT